MNYDIDYFIAKFEAIPDERWTAEDFETAGGKRCALGHCGCRVGYEDPPMALGLWQVSRLDPSGFRSVITVNDGLDRDFQQPTPKARVLAWLRALKRYYE